MAEMKSLPKRPRRDICRKKIFPDKTKSRHRLKEKSFLTQRNPPVTLLFDFFDAAERKCAGDQTQRGRCTVKSGKVSG